MLIQIDNFFPNLDLILPEIKKIKLYSLDEFNKITNASGKNSWPGYRSLPLHTIQPILLDYLMYLMKNKNITKDAVQITSYLHLRLEEHKDKDWIHKDETDYAALIYLSETNLNSGTCLYDDNKNLINDIKFVKNRFIMYDSKYNHMGYGHHGSSIEDGRLTINLFINKIK